MNSEIYLGLRGIFEFKNQFKERSETICEVIKMATIDSLILDGLDVYQDIYLSNGISEDQYKKDMENKTFIVFFKNDKGETFYLPSTSIVKTPSENTRDYTQYTLAIVLEKTPINQDFKSIFTQLKSLVKDELGLESKVALYQTGVIEPVDEATHLIKEKERQSKINTYLNKDREMKEKDLLIEALTSKNEELLKLLISS